VKDSSRKLQLAFSTPEEDFSLNLTLLSLITSCSLEHETTDQAVSAFKEYASELKSKGWNVTNVADLQGLPWYQNQFGGDDPVIKVDSILPTIAAIDVTDSSAAAGSSGAPDTSAFRAALLGNSSSQNSVIKVAGPTTLNLTNGADRLFASSSLFALPFIGLTTAYLM